MDVFDTFSSSGGASPPAGRRRSLGLAALAVVAALIAVVGGAAAAAKILLPDDATKDCTAAQVSQQDDIAEWVHDVIGVAAPDDPTRDVLTLGCDAGGEAVGAHAGVVDDAELAAMTDVLAQAGCQISPQLPASCRTYVGEVPVLIQITADVGAPDGDYDLAVTVDPSGAGA